VVVEIPIRLRRRVGQSKGASQSIWKGLAVGLAMIWHIMTFRLKPRASEPAAVADRDESPPEPSAPVMLAGASGSRDK
jgi:hypothetical protein